MCQHWLYACVDAVVAVTAIVTALPADCKRSACGV